MTPTMDWWALIERAGTVGLLLIILWGFIKTPPWWVTYGRYKETSEQRDLLLKLAIDTIRLVQGGNKIAGDALDTLSAIAKHTAAKEKDKEE